MARGLTPAGSTSRWRRTRWWVLERDGWCCQLPAADGRPCLAQLVQHPPGYACTDAACRDRHAHVDHVVPRALYVGPDPDDPANLRAACQLHNLQRAAAQTNAARRVITAHPWL